MAAKVKERPPVKAEPETRWGWKNGTYGRLDARAAGPELERIAAANGAIIEHLKPKVVVDEARPAESPIHSAFEWRTEVAAQKYNEDQARSLIRNLVRIEILPAEVRPAVDIALAEPPEAPKQTVGFIHVNLPDVGACYVSTSKVMADPDMREQAVRDALSLLRGIRKRFEHLSELRDVFAAIEQAAQRIT